ncbi:hypothetical protein EYC84_001464 [Monilinia fructicola]|uniref:Uncharacterized protein n=1 Tax=Monilinia fructicola TaxID=38448 RepID=A0A5M9JPP5_MONFR|nr:hypothetical protein EYC84_001464 [Monilinia fructicola]
MTKERALASNILGRNDSMNGEEKPQGTIAMVEPVLKLNHHLLGDFKPGPALTFGVLDTPMACTRFVSDLDNWDDGSKKKE